jgi:hypothetical protein
MPVLVKALEKDYIITFTYFESLSHAGIVSEHATFFFRACAFTGTKNDFSVTMQLMRPAYIAVLY